MQPVKSRLPGLKKRDWLFAAALLVLSAALLFWLQTRPDGGTAVITQDGREVLRQALSRQTEYRELHLGGDYDVVVALEPGAVYFLHSDCPDQVCVRSGKLTRPGQAAACLPAKISVVVEGGGAAYDGITG